MYLSASNIVTVRCHAQNSDTKCSSLGVIEGQQLLGGGGSILLVHTEYLIQRKDEDWDTGPKGGGVSQDSSTRAPGPTSMVLVHPMEHAGSGW